MIVLNNCCHYGATYSIRCSCHACHLWGQWLLSRLAPRVLGLGGQLSPANLLSLPPSWVSHLPLGPQCSHLTSCWLWRKVGQWWVGWAYVPCPLFIWLTDLQGRGFTWQHRCVGLYNMLMVKAGSDASAPAVLVLSGPDLMGLRRGMDSPVSLVLWDHGGRRK